MRHFRLPPRLLLAALASGCVQTASTGATTGGQGGASTSSSTGTSLAAGAPCASSASCASGICGVTAEGGNCCTIACARDESCGATACDGTGACVYPPEGTSCGVACSDAVLRSRSCDGSGYCRGRDGGSPCPDNFGCNDGGGCNLTCASPLDCAPGFACKGGACVAPAKTGPCGTNFDCASGVCGASGVGNCCAAPCNSTLAPCGALDCDPLTGACLYADAGTSCGTGVCVEGAPGQTLCDGLGQCSLMSCAPYLCGPGACQTSCTAFSSSCSQGAFCDPDTSACCDGLGDGGAMLVDAVLGSDSVPCCGFAGAAPCQTLTHAMTLIAAAEATNVTITATVDGGGGDWAPAGEAPIVIGWGAELVAPGVYFRTLDISTVPDDGLVSNESVVGSADQPVFVGVSAAGEPWSNPLTIHIEPGHTLYLANARVIGSTNVNYMATTIEMDDRASLVFGQDQSSAVTGTVQIGDPAATGDVGTDLVGIDCERDCNIRDAVLKEGVSSVVIQGQLGWDLRAGGSSVISLTSAPVFGVPPSSTGFGTCPAKPDEGIDLFDSARMTIANGTVQCIAFGGAGFFLSRLYADAGPTLTLSNSTIQNCAIGVGVQEGTATIASSTIWFNDIGVGQYEGGTVDLSGGALGGTNTVACTSPSEAGRGDAPAAPSFSVLNLSAETLNASNVNWDTAGPDQFQCDSTGTMCTCQIASCVNPGGVDGMDAVNESSGSITTTGHGLANVACVPPP